MANEQFRGNSFEDHLAHLVEECGEVLHIVGKIGRFGLESRNPLVPMWEQRTNRDLLKDEISDLKEVIRHLENYL